MELNREVTLGGTVRTVSLTEPVARYPHNPILTARQVNAVWTQPHRQVVTVHNAGVAVVGGETVMLFRSHLRSGISVIGLARSRDGITDWRVDPEPFLLPARPDDRMAPGLDPADLVEIEAGGVEDPRINPIDGTFAITYSGYAAQARNRVRVALATTDDFAEVTRFGPVLDADMRNVVLFPERIGGRYVGLFRPNDELPGDTGGTFREIRIGSTMDFRAGPWAIAARAGHAHARQPQRVRGQDRPGRAAGADPARLAEPLPRRAGHDGRPPVRARHRPARPGRARSGSRCRASRCCSRRRPTVASASPTTSTCPTWCSPVRMLRRADGSLLIYYGGNDTVMNVAVSHEDVLAALCQGTDRTRATGRPNYAI